MSEAQIVPVPNCGVQEVVLVEAQDSEKLPLGGTVPVFGPNEVTAGLPPPPPTLRHWFRLPAEERTITLPLLVSMLTAATLVDVDSVIGATLSREMVCAPTGALR